jgi:hypothetical protein
MRTTIDLPDPLLERVKISAAKQQTTLRDLVIRGLESVLMEPTADEPASARSALQRLRRGYALGNQPLSRDQIHADRLRKTHPRRPQHPRRPAEERPPSHPLSQTRNC